MHEHDVYHVQQRLETMLQTRLPAGLGSIDLELHGAEIKSPDQGFGRRPRSPWAQFDYGFRLSMLRADKDKDMASADVAGKHQAALRWANHVNKDSKVSATWRYLLVSEADVKTAKGSWSALESLGGA